MKVIEKAATPTMLEFAEEYLQNRFSIIPLVVRDKRPSIPSWELYQKVQAKKEEIDRWFSNGGENNNNIAIVTGRVSRIIVFDIDGERARNHFERVVGDLGDEEIRTAIKNTMLIKTGSGNTNIVIGFRPEEFVVENKLLKNSVLWYGSDGDGGSNVDHGRHNEIRLKGEGGYIVAPPSIHPNGNRYEIINNANSPVTFSKIQISKLISALKKQINEANIPASINSNKVNLVDSNESSDDDTQVRQKQEEEKKQQQYQLIDEERIFKIVASLKPHYQQGLRNDFVLYLSGWMKKRGVAIESAYKVIEGLTENDEERQARFRTLEETYKKQDPNDIKGYAGLVSIILTDQIKDNEKVLLLLQEVDALLPSSSLSPSETQSKKKNIDETTTEADETKSQVLIKLA